jgi:hypothetical protein
LSRLGGGGVHIAIGRPAKHHCADNGTDKCDHHVEHASNDREFAECRRDL